MKSLLSANKTFSRPYKSKVPPHAYQISSGDHMHSPRPNCLECWLKIEQFNESCSGVVSLFNSKRVFICVVMSFRLESVKKMKDRPVSVQQFWMRCKSASNRELVLFQSVDESSLQQWHWEDAQVFLWGETGIHADVFAFFGLREGIFFKFFILSVVIYSHFCVIFFHFLLWNVADLEIPRTWKKKKSWIHCIVFCMWQYI